MPKKKSKSLKEFADILAGTWKVWGEKNDRKHSIYPNRVIWDTRTKRAKIVATRGKRGAEKGKFAANTESAVRSLPLIEKGYEITFCMLEPDYKTHHEYCWTKVVKAWEGKDPRPPTQPGYKPFHVMETDCTVIEKPQPEPKPEPFACPF